MFVYLSAYDCSLFDDERLRKRERGAGGTGCVRNHPHTACDNILPDNERNLCLSLCLKYVHATQVCGTYIYTNMIKGYIAGHASIVVNKSLCS